MKLRKNVQLFEEALGDSFCVLRFGSYLQDANFSRKLLLERSIQKHDVFIARPFKPIPKGQY